MASGKTAIGRHLASRLRRPFIDLDESIEAQQGRSIASIFETDGEVGFRRIEAEAVRALNLQEPSVISTGGGTFVDPANREVLRSHGVVVCLIASFETIMERIRRGSKRPLAKGPEAARRLEELWLKRMDAYRSADVLVETDGLSIDQSSARVAAMLEPRLRRAGDA